MGRKYTISEKGVLQVDGAKVECINAGSENVSCITNCAAFEYIQKGQIIEMGTDSTPAVKSRAILHCCKRIIKLEDKT